MQSISLPFFLLAIFGGTISGLSGVMARLSGATSLQSGLVMNAFTAMAFVFAIVVASLPHMSKTIEFWTIVMMGAFAFAIALVLASMLLVASAENHPDGMKLFLSSILTAVSSIAFMILLTTPGLKLSVYLPVAILAAFTTNILCGWKFFNEELAWNVILALVFAYASAGSFILPTLLNQFALVRA